jgi:sugar O-acyltransferase (sialic acid O-acetyltransferase NeuD family)
MTHKRIVVYGAGGHGKLVGDVLLARGQQIDSFVDDNPSRAGQTVLGVPVISSQSFWQEAAQQPAAVVLGVGNNWARKKIAERCANAGIQILTVIHPTAIISKTASIGDGTAIMAGVVVNPDAQLGRGVILNSGAVVEHDVVLGAYAHISTNVALGGESTVGEFSVLGVGAAMRPLARVGAGSIVGAGSVVISDVPDGVVAVGVPARVVRAMSDSKEKTKTMTAQGRG